MTSATEAFVGTSAGSIVAARWPRAQPRAGPRGAGTGAAAGRRRHGRGAEPRSAAGRAAAARRSAGGSAALLGGRRATAPLALAALARGPRRRAGPRALPARACPERRAALDELRERVERWGARFDGRLRWSRVDRAAGRRVVFGAPGAPAATVGEAVAASCAVPVVFRPVTIGGREYVDGGVWSLTNLDAAPAGRDTPCCA